MSAFLGFPGIQLPCNLWNIFDTGDAPKAEAHTPNNRAVVCSVWEAVGLHFPTLFSGEPSPPSPDKLQRAGAANSLTLLQCPGDYQTPNERV